MCTFRNVVNQLLDKLNRCLCGDLAEWRRILQQTEMFLTIYYFFASSIFTVTCMCLSSQYFSFLPLSSSLCKQVSMFVLTSGGALHRILYPNDFSFSIRSPCQSPRSCNESLSLPFCFSHSFGVPLITNERRVWLVHKQAGKQCKQ